MLWACDAGDQHHDLAGVAVVDRLVDICEAVAAGQSLRRLQVANPNGPQQQAAIDHDRAVQRLALERVASRGRVAGS